MYFKDLNYRNRIRYYLVQNFGFTNKDVKNLILSGKIKVNQKTGVRTITELKLYEGSAVLWGANPETPTLGFKSEIKETKESLSIRLENLIKAFRGGSFTDDTFALMEIQIKQIQAELLTLEITETITQPAEAVEPTPEVEESAISDPDLQDL